MAGTSVAEQPGPSEPAPAVTWTASAVTSPEPEYVIVVNSSGVVYASGCGETRSNSGGAVSLK